ncbi:hypothetical protein BV22DRAFT_1000969, partial [Leucogyrophana mollusca]
HFVLERYSSLVFFGTSSPGRFFASNVMKAMMAHLVINFDIKLKQEGVRPSDQWFQMNYSPNRTAEVMFRRRQPQL